MAVHEEEYRFAWRLDHDRLPSVVRLVARLEIVSAGRGEVGVGAALCLSRVCAVLECGRVVIAEAVAGSSGWIDFAQGGRARPSMAAVRVQAL